VPATEVKKNVQNPGVAEIDFWGFDDPLLEVDLKRAQYPNHEGLRSSLHIVSCAGQLFRAYTFTLSLRGGTTTCPGEAESEDGSNPEKGKGKFRTPFL